LDGSSHTFWVYVLENSAGQFHVGITEDMHRRFQQHNYQSAAASFKCTQAKGPWVSPPSRLFSKVAAFSSKFRFSRTAWLLAER
jgi:hypothetical protein